MAAKRTPVVSLQPLLLGLGFALLVVISAATVYLVDRAADDLQRLTQTLRVEDQLSNVLLDVRRAESSQRGYLFTNNQDYLKEFYEAEPQARQLLAELRTLTKDNPARQAMLDEATKLIDAKFKEMSATVVLSQQGRRDEARNLVLTGAGRTIADQLRKMIDGAISDEAHLAATRRDQSRQTNRMLLYVTLAGAAVNTGALRTEELYARAIALFDTALTLAGDSSRFGNLAKVGKGRVLLDQGKFAEAAAAVADVPLTFVYNAEFKSGLSFVVGGNGYNDENWLQYPYTGGSVVVAAQDRPDLLPGIRELVDLELAHQKPSPSNAAWSSSSSRGGAAGSSHRWTGSG